jgi:hypothetical protein
MHPQRQRRIDKPQGLARMHAGDAGIAAEIKARPAVEPGPRGVELGRRGGAASDGEAQQRSSSIRRWRRCA